MITSIFFLFVYLLYKSELVLVKKDTKKSPKQQTNQTITEHLIEITTHKIQCSKHTLWSPTEHHTLVASYLCYWIRFRTTAVVVVIVVFFIPVSENEQHTVPQFWLSCNGRFRSAAPACTHVSAGCWQCVCSCLVKKVGPVHKLFHTNN